MVKIYAKRLELLKKSFSFQNLVSLNKIAQFDIKNTSDAQITQTISLETHLVKPVRRLLLNSEMSD